MCDRQCKKCGNVKLLDQYRIQKSNRDGYSLVCRTCNNKASKKLENEKKKYASIVFQQERLNGLNRKQFSSKDAYTEYKNDIRKKAVEEFTKKRERKDVKKTMQWRRATSLRTQLRSLIRNLNPSKRIIDIVGCDHMSLKQHIESKFKQNMNWDNYGKHGWHIDHILPCRSFDLTLESEIRKCFHFSNLQPLWASENWSKGFSIVPPLKDE